MKTNVLDASFRATSYQVETSDGVFRLRIGEIHPEFDNFLRRLELSCWGVITAYNPGRVLREEDNAERQIRLLERIEELGWPHFPACNIADDDLWPVEPGYLLLQVREMAVAIPELPRVLSGFDFPDTARFSHHRALMRVISMRHRNDEHHEQEDRAI